MATMWKVKNGTWVIQYKDGLSGKRKTYRTNSPDKRNAEIMMGKLTTDAMYQREGIIDPSMVKAKENRDIPLSDHLDDFGAYQRTSSGAEHVDATRRIIERIALDRDWDRLHHINADGLTNYMDAMKRAKKSSRTIGSYLTAVRSLCIWSVKVGRLTADPTKAIKKPTVTKKRVRRFLTHEEWQWLESTTRSSEPLYGMTGQERALCYTIALQTGLRSSEVASLTRGAVNLTAKSPYVTAPGSSTKNGEFARQYIQPELADELKAYAGKKLAGAKLLPMPPVWDVSRMFPIDLEAARQAWLATINDPQAKIDADGTDFLKSVDSADRHLDFHSFRHSTGVWLVEAGCDIKTLQQIMRHSTITLTLDTYGHLFEGREALEVSKLRSAFSKPASESKKA